MPEYLHSTDMGGEGRISYNATNKPALGLRRPGERSRKYVSSWRIGLIFRAAPGLARSSSLIRKITRSTEKIVATPPRLFVF